MTTERLWTPEKPVLVSFGTFKKTTLSGLFQVLDVFYPDIPVTNESNIKTELGFYVENDEEHFKLTENPNPKLRCEGQPQIIQPDILQVAQFAVEVSRSEFAKTEIAERLLLCANEFVAERQTVVRQAQSLMDLVRTQRQRAIG